MALGMLLGERLGGQTGALLYQGMVALAMFAPLLGVLTAHGGLKKAKTGISWKPQLVGRARWYIIGWLAPPVIAIVGAGLFFLLFPSRFDGSVSYLTNQIPAGTELPFPLPVLVLLQILSSVAYAPLLNMFLAVGEEAGWRGFLTPALQKRLGRIGGLLLSGVLWAVWHWPLILCAAYEYGAGYWGAPYTGMLLMCLFTTALGILLSWLYDRAGSIWAPALAHGAVNATAGIGVMFLDPRFTSFILGPTPAGLVAGIPLFALAAWLLMRKDRPEQRPEAPEMTVPAYRRVGEAPEDAPDGLPVLRMQGGGDPDKEHLPADPITVSEEGK